MRFPSLTSQSEIDQQLRRCPPQQNSAPPLPWGCALFGFTLFLLMQTLL